VINDTYLKTIIDKATVARLATIDSECRRPGGAFFLANQCKWRKDRTSHASMESQITFQIYYQPLLLWMKRLQMPLLSEWKDRFHGQKMTGQLRTYLMVHLDIS
jgi:hypothetical protein